MNRNEYLERIDTQNGYCDCPELARLYESKRRTDDLAERCNNISENLDLAYPSKKNKVALEGYAELAEDFQESARNYFSELENGVNRGRIKLISHDFRSGKTRQITREEAKSLIEGENPIISLNCANCDQQIDIWRH